VDELERIAPEHVALAETRAWQSDGRSREWVIERRDIERSGSICSQKVELDLDRKVPIVSADQKIRPPDSVAGMIGREPRAGDHLDPILERVEGCLLCR